MSQPSTGKDRSDLELFREYTSTRARSTRNRLIELHVGLAVHIARRYGRSDIADDDLQQVAMLGLVKAVDRFDPERGVPFSAFAGATIEGELKRHFRDHTWTVRVPRSAKDLHLAIGRATDELVQLLGRSPDVDEVAQHLDLERDEILRGMAATAASTVDPLVGGPDVVSGPDHEQHMATEERGFGAVEDASIVEALLDRLPEREREIVRLRFFEQMSQTQIAEAVGLSQMHVSRLLQQSFTQMRNWATEPAPPDRPD
jgi:RNA polymerase sigma-B factor